MATATSSAIVVSGVLSPPSQVSVAAATLAALALLSASDETVGISDTSIGPGPLFGVSATPVWGK